MSLFSNNTIATNTAAQTRRILAGEFALMQRKRRGLIILILLFVCMIAWGMVSIFSSQKSTKIKAETQALAAPLNPVIDEKIFTVLNEKRSYTDDELANFPIFRIRTDARTGNSIIESVN